MAEPTTPTTEAAPAPAKSAAPAEHRLLVTSSPHVGTPESVPRIMHTVWLALLPAAAAAVWLFGYDALLVIGLTVAACVGFEALMLKARGLAWDEVRHLAFDGSAIVAGVLLAFNLPATAPWWIVLVGAFVAMGLGKHVFGGLGHNPFNPALVARIFLVISFPTQMAVYISPVDSFTQSSAERLELDLAEFDGQTYATPLGRLKDAVRAQADPAKVEAIRAEVAERYPVADLFLGRTGGALGETSALALLLGAALLLWRRIITWHIPLSFLGTTAVVTGIAWAVHPELYAEPLVYLLSGGLILGACFMATDMVTSPVSRTGMLVFGAGCGLITAVIRLWGGYPEGVAFSILIMNALVPLIDRYTKGRKFGETRRAAA
ncbi:MAG: RnfABCDGE type electron transport complex subunit D [Deltaproteobacteria bacterium]|nr:RnfABCDGE type electron transport complex subunit D [Deltaproteobacteria bacterium]